MRNAVRTSSFALIANSLCKEGLGGKRDGKDLWSLFLTLLCVVFVVGPLSAEEGPNPEVPHPLAGYSAGP